jgi:hypothetical protein
LQIFDFRLNKLGIAFEICNLKSTI